MSYLLITNVYDCFDEITEQVSNIVDTELEALQLLDDRTITNFVVYTIVEGKIAEVKFQDKLESYQRNIQQEKWDKEACKKKMLLNEKRKLYLSYLDFNTCNTQSRIIGEIRSRISTVLLNEISNEDVKHTLPRLYKVIKSMREKDWTFDEWYKSKVMNYKFGVIDNILT